MAQTKNVNMTPNDTLPRLRLSQYDVGRELAFKLCDGALSYTVPTGATVKLMGTKPSGFGFTESCTVSGNTASISTTAGMTDEWGAVVCELVVEKSGVRLGSTNLLLVVEKSPHPEGTTDGSQETVIPTLTLLVERVETAASSILDMTVEAETLAAGSDATYSYDEETNTATFGIPRGADGSLASGVLAPTYSTSGTYAVGDYVYYSGNLYRCTTAITTAESWTSGHWTQVALAPEVSDLKSEINALYEEITLSYTNNDGKYIKANGGLATDNVTHTSDFVAVTEGQELFLDSIPSASGFYCLAFYTKTEAVGANCTGVYQSSDLSDSIIVPSASAYMLYSYPSNKTAGTISKGNTHFISDIKPPQTTFFETKNLFNIYADNLIGKYYDASNTLVTSASYGQSDLIEVVAGYEYTSAETGFNVNFYDEDGTFVSSVTSSAYNTAKKVTIPSGAKYARFGFTKAQIESFWVHCLSESLYQIDSDMLPHLNRSVIDSNKKLKFLACAIRNTGTGWKFINDAEHNPLNFASVGASAKIRLTYSFTAKKVLSLVVAPDETFAKDYDVGGSVGLSYSDLNVYAKPKVYGGKLVYSSGVWDSTGANFTSVTSGEGTLTLTHNSVSAYDDTDKYNISVNGVGCDVSISSVTDTGIVLAVGNLTDGAEIYCTRSMPEALVTASDVVSLGGNFWVFGVMEL